MTDNAFPQEAANAAANPYTDPEALRNIAYQYPQLRPVIALNPSVYPALLEWLGTLGDPQVNAALTQRAQMAATNQSSLAHAQTSQFYNTQQVNGVYPTPDQSTPSNSNLFPQEPEEKRKGNRGLLMAIVFLLILLAAALVVLFILLSQNHFPASNTAQSNITSEQSSSVNPDSAVEDNKGSAQDKHNSSQSASDAPALHQTIRYPAASNAIKQKQIVSPSKNITCSLSELGVSCVLNENSFDYSSKGCPSKQHVIVSADEEHTSNGCTNAFKPVGQTLPYGSDAQFGRFACRSQDWGMTCWNMYSGKSFAIARAGYVLSDKGSVPAKNFPWS